MSLMETGVWRHCPWRREALLGQEPAQCSIVLTTVMDVVGFLSFLGIATLLATMI